MKLRSTWTAGLLSLIILGSCDNDSDEFVENAALRDKLEGTWVREQTDTLYTYHYSFHEVTFTATSINWYDSIVILEKYLPVTGHISAMRGSCPVLYTFRDGIEHYDADGKSGYSFQKFSQNDVLWVLADQVTENVYKNYRVSDGVASFTDEFASEPHFHSVLSSAVTLSYDQNTVTFCEPRDTKWCYDFLRK